jgi:hypothetical protein
MTQTMPGRISGQMAHTLPPAFDTRAKRVEWCRCEIGGAPIGAGGRDPRVLNQGHSPYIPLEPMSMKLPHVAIVAILTLAPIASASAQDQVDLETFKARYSSMSATEIAAHEAALAKALQAAQSSWARPKGPVQGDLCTAPSPTPVNPFTVSSTTVGATNNYDIATTCGVTQTLFAGTGAALDVAFGVVADANCSITAVADPTGTNWDLALYVLQAPGAACTQLPALADAQCTTMDDDGASNTTETVTWAATAGTEYFVIVDGFNAATGTFDLTITGTGCNLVPVELQNFSVD